MPVVPAVIVPKGGVLYERMLKSRSVIVDDTHISTGRPGSTFYLTFTRDELAKQSGAGTHDKCYIDLMADDMANRMSMCSCLGHGDANSSWHTYDQKFIDWIRPQVEVATAARKAHFANGSGATLPPLPPLPGIIIKAPRRGRGGGRGRGNKRQRT